jgi:hypothetical protein
VPGRSRTRTTGDGTITDNNTGLMWEKKDQSGGVHDWTNFYMWGMRSPPYTMNGTMVTTFLATLNAGTGFAGHTDWRIPNVKELQSIVNYERPLPAPTVDGAFNTDCTAGCTVLTCSCTQSGPYWSSTTIQNNPNNAWNVNFNNGNVNNNNKDNNNYVRAVRGGCDHGPFVRCPWRVARLPPRAVLHAYQPGPSICFVTDGPKPREVFAADFRDRIVHHVLVSRLEPVFEPRFIHDACACRKGKGVLAASDRLMAFLRRISANGRRPAWALKLDGAAHRLDLARQREAFPQLRSTLASYSGHLRHGGAYRKWAAVWRRHGWLRALFVPEPRTPWRVQARWTERALGGPRFAAQYRRLIRHAGDRALVFCEVGRFVEFYGPQRYVATGVLRLLRAKIARGRCAFSVGVPLRLSSEYVSRAVRAGYVVPAVREVGRLDARCAERRVVALYVPALGAHAIRFLPSNVVR